jgi:hypothetical protein
MTTRLETIANKVVKYMLTAKGSDLVEPDYGAEPIYYNPSLSSRLVYDVSNVIEGCSAYIKKYELTLDNTIEKLQKLNLLSVDVDGTTLNIHVSILTTFNNYALLDWEHARNY